MKNQHQLRPAARAVNYTTLRLYPVITAGLLFLFITTSAGCSTFRLQLNQLNPPNKIDLPRNVKFAAEDSNLTKETACIVRIKDTSGNYFVDKDQFPREVITEKVASKLKDQPPDKRIVYIESIATISYAEVVELLASIRKADVDRIGLVVERINSKEIGNRPSMFEVKIPDEPRDDEIIKKPNPLTLVVEIDKSGAIQLNKDPMGFAQNPDQTDALMNKLTAIFKERETNGVFREGTNEVEKTVFIKGARSVRYGDVIRVIDAVKGAGAEPIGLQIDDLMN